MLNFRCVLAFIFLLCSFSTHSAILKQQHKAFRSFWHPIYNGGYLDYCTVDGKDCGRAVANRYCRMLGYDRSNQHMIAHNIGITHYISTRARCKGWQCNGFMMISCATNLSHTPPQTYHYREKLFVDPRFGHYRVDWCYDRKQGCGARAANAFCRHMGFMSAKHFVKEIQIGATKTIGSEELCFGKECKAFKTIVCYR
jgi:hypothetical protein